MDNETILRLERMAALELTEDERRETAAQMNAVLACLNVLCGYPAEFLQEEDTHSVLRADEASPCADRAALLANAPETDGVYFLVPRTVE